MNIDTILIFRAIFNFISTTFHSARCKLLSIQSSRKLWPQSILRIWSSNHLETCKNEHPHHDVLSVVGVFIILGFSLGVRMLGFCSSIIKIHVKVNIIIIAPNIVAQIPNIHIVVNIFSPLRWEHFSSFLYKIHWFHYVVFWRRISYTNNISLVVVVCAKTASCS